MLSELVDVGAHCGLERNAPGDQFNSTNVDVRQLAAPLLEEFAWVVGEDHVAHIVLVLQTGHSSERVIEEEDCEEGHSEGKHVSLCWVDIVLPSQELWGVVAMRSAEVVCCLVDGLDEGEIYQGQNLLVCENKVVWLEILVSLPLDGVEMVDTCCYLLEDLSLTLQC